MQPIYNKMLRRTIENDAPTKVSIASIQPESTISLRANANYPIRETVLTH
jgi:hypothetical protein